MTIVNAHLTRALAGILTVIALLLSAPNFAQPSAVLNTALIQKKIDLWQTEQGLPFETVQTTYQTRDGLLWVGKTGGVARFDGLRFETFELQTLPKPLTGPIFGFFEDAQGGLWIGHNRGAMRYRNGVFEPVFDSEITQGRRVWAFTQGRDGVVWAATENGLVRWTEGAVKRYGVDQGLPTNRLRSLAFDKAGTLWIGTTGGGLVSFAGETFSTMNPSNGFPHLDVRHVLSHPSGGVWAATAGAGLVHFDRGVVKHFTVANGLPTNQLTYLARDTEGGLWVGTWGAGIVRFHDERFSPISSAGGLAGDHIWSVSVDREGSVWVGTWNNGLNRVSNRVFGVLGKREGLTHDNVRSVIHARDGAIWVATAGGGVNKIHSDRITAITKKNGLATDESSTLLEARDGAIWIGSYTEGVARWRNGVLSLFSTESGLPSVDVRVLFEDNAGTIWAGTQSGLARFIGKGFAPVREPGAPREGVNALLQDKNGVMWIGTAGQGLVRLRDGKFDTFSRKEGLVASWIFSLYEDASGTLWIGTNGGGLNRLRDGKISAITPDDGLPDGLAQVILEDRAGHFWITGNRGFYRVARADLDAVAEGTRTKVSSTTFGAGNVLRSATFAGGLQAAGNLDAKGRVWLPSLKGLVIVDPARLPSAEPPPTPALSEVKVNGALTFDRDEIILPTGAIPLAIRYSADTLLNADRVRFRYQLEGLNTDWVDAGRSREAAFPALPHGRYRFRVAASLDGVRWQEAAQALPIEVNPYFYQTPWFAGIALCGLLGAAYGFVRFRTHQHGARHAEMERMVTEKTEALRLANEHLSRLSLVDPLTGLANRRRLDEVLDMEWRRALRLRTHLSIVIIDIDAFKAYNDTLGHPEGDKCLVTVADVIRETANRAGDFAARYGGEEFLIVIPGSDYPSAVTHAEQIRQACEARAIPHPFSPVGPVVTVSLGIAACIPDDATTVDRLISQADAALYKAKNEGRNKVR